MKEIFDTLDLVENSESPVLTDGESVPGKEVMAIAVGNNNLRRDKMVVIKNCSSFNETLLTSDFFWMKLAI